MYFIEMNVVRWMVNSLKDLTPVRNLRYWGMTSLHFLLMLFIFIGLALPGIAQQSETESKAKIKELEKKLASLPKDQFDWDLHNELRHHYGAVDPARSMKHVEIILKNRPSDDYMKQVLGGKDPDSAKAVASLLDTAKKYSKLANLKAACLLWAGELESNPKSAESILRRVVAEQDAVPTYRIAAEELLRTRFGHKGTSANAKPKKVTRTPEGMEKRPGPWNDPADQTVWPNQTSNANSDPWLVENHDQIRLMRPRVLIINFSNEHTTDHIANLSRQLINALGEGSRYHGYKSAESPVFLEYQIFKYVDLRDPTSKVGNSSRIPVKDPKAKNGFNMKYASYFSEEFARYYAVPSPDDPKKFLNLAELLDGGYVHEVWFVESGNVNAAVHVGSYEVVEEKPRYNDKFEKIPNQWVQAGNGGDPDQPWCGRSCRIGCINASRGIGCFLESLAHGIEGTANSDAIPYLSKYFREFADFDLDKRYGLPFKSLYGVSYRDQEIEYPAPNKMIITHNGGKHVIDDYIARGGNAHFPPNGRRHYDLDNPNPVMSTIEDWRIGSGPGGKDIAKPFTNQAFRAYRDLAPDCMGAWLVYWRQNMPGLNNKQKDDQGRPMKNWIPFLFY